MARSRLSQESLMFRPLALASLAALLALPAAARADGPLDAYLPKSGTIEGHVMTLSVAPEDQAIDRQFRAAVANNMDWFKKAVTGNKPGQPLPYDPRMGITPAQYQQLQHMKADFHPGAPITIKVDHKDGKIAFSSSDPAAAGLATVTFPADEKVAETSTASTRTTRARRSACGPAPSGRASLPRATTRRPARRRRRRRRSPSASATPRARA
jgi:hypothetical protein